MPVAPIISLCHGGGPLPVLGDPDHAELITAMSKRIPELLHIGTPAAPKAILVISAHWEEDQPTILCSEKPSILFDYGGFPAEAYELKYDAPGAVDIAKLAFDELKRAGFDPAMEQDRGWDHGVFIPMTLINPSANIPILQISLLASQSPSDLFNQGQALSSLRAQNIAIIGSGSTSFHNFRALATGRTRDPAYQATVRAFNKKLNDAVRIQDSDKRKEYLRGWEEFPGANEIHPVGASEHFSPFLVCCGAAGKQRGEGWVDMFLGLEFVGFWWN